MNMCLSRQRAASVSELCLRIRAFASSRGSTATGEEPKIWSNRLLLFTGAGAGTVASILVLSLRFEVGWSWEAIKRPKNSCPSCSVTREAVLCTGRMFENPGTNYVRVGEGEGELRVGRGETDGGGLSVEISLNFRGARSPECMHDKWECDMPVLSCVHTYTYSATL